MAERAAAAENLPTISREEKALMGEVNESTEPEEEDEEQVMASSEVTSSSKKNSSPEKPKKMEESLIEF